MKCILFVRGPSPGLGASDWSVVALKSSDWPLTEGSSQVSRRSCVEAQTGFISQ